MSKQKTEPKPEQPPIVQKWKKWIISHKFQVGIGAGILVVILLGIGVGVGVWKQQTRASQHNANTGQETKKNKKRGDNSAPVPVTMARRLDGLVVATGDANKVPACVMIENAAFSGVRPQSGLSAAPVVYEIIVEGGITRLMAVFGGEHADQVGPVRSARDTYLEFASEYNCGYAHAGGSYTAMLAIPRFELRDLEALRESQWFWRDSSKYSPHNLFTSTDNLANAISTGHSWTDAPTFDSWKFVNDAELPSGDAATEVNILLGGAYNVTYTYNTDGKYYERTNGGVLQTDANTGQTLSTRNVIVEHVPAGDFIEGKGRVNFSVTGEGEVEIFRNGVVTKGVWKKADRVSRTKYFTSDGQEIPLARGNSWVEVVPEGYSVEWK